MRYFFHRKSSCQVAKDRLKTADLRQGQLFAGVYGADQIRYHKGDLKIYEDRHHEYGHTDPGKGE